ncbi:hypothetical protein [Clostridium chromiireducens]
MNNKFRILVADDEQNILDVVRSAFLENEGVERAVDSYIKNILNI